ncbi:hypothetical protein BUALT_Bualt12G0039400 [Buddleja alternifolia]|uniref:Uncharacterized protein n=1 Tax=Buddleja alternifolia TaxID=168488 RepID=A0AAV6WNW2_9LAMI|nr:hypothetical protein BUALT_Bualt12G0039400 [Buddleja alternifolia]
MSQPGSPKSSGSTVAASTASSSASTSSGAHAPPTTATQWLPSSSALAVTALSTNAFSPPTYIPHSLIDFLSDQNYTFVGVNIASNLNNLYEDYETGDAANTVDLRYLAAAKYECEGLKNAGMKRLAMIVNSYIFHDTEWFDS